MSDTQNYHEWTSCEVYGHNFEPLEESDPEVPRSCLDCGELSE